MPKNIVKITQNPFNGLMIVKDNISSYNLIYVPIGDMKKNYFVLRRNYLPALYFSSAGSILLKDEKGFGKTYEALHFGIQSFQTRLKKEPIVDYYDKFEGEREFFSCVQDAACIGAICLGFKGKPTGIEELVLLDLFLSTDSCTIEYGGKSVPLTRSFRESLLDSLGKEKVEE